MDTLTLLQNNEISQLKEQVLAELKEAKHKKDQYGTYCFWYVIEKVMGKLNSISDELNDTWIKYSNDINDVSAKESIIQKDIQEMEKEGKKDGSGKISADQVKKFASDLKALKASVQKLKDDFHFDSKESDRTPFENKVHQMIGDISKNVDMLDNEKIRSDSADTVGSLVQKINDGDKNAVTTLQKHFTDWANKYAGHDFSKDKNYKNDKVDNLSNVFDTWINGNNDTTSDASGLEPLASEMTTEITNSNNQLQTDGQKVNSIYDTDKAMNTAQNTFVSDIVRNQRSS